MHIVEVTSQYPNPAQPFISEKVASLADRGHHVVVVADRGPGQADQRCMDRRDGRVEVRWRARTRKELALSFLSARARDPVAVKRAVTLTRSRENRATELALILPLLDPWADVIDFEWVNEAARLVPYMEILKPPTVLTVHGSDVRVSPLESKRSAQRIQDMLAAADVIRCVSSELAERATELGAPQDAIRVVPVGVDTSWFRGPDVRHVHGGPLRLVSVGRLHWIKGYEYALQAVRQLLDSGLDVSYTIVGGDDGGAGEVRLAARDLHLEEHVRMPGSLDRVGVRAILAISDVFVLSSVSEGASTSTLEAMAMGLPVVATTAGGTPELIEGELGGFLVPPREPGAMAAAIFRLRDLEVRAAMGRLASQHVRRHFDASAQLDRVVRTYEELARPIGSTEDVDEELVSVVVPVRNAERTIDEQLRALSNQLYDGRWEVVVADNGSSDSTRERVLSWTGKLPGLRLVDASFRPGRVYARNIGVRQSCGPRIVLCESDDVVAPGWLQALADALVRDPIVVGRLEPTIPGRPRRRSGHLADDARLGAQLEPLFSTRNIGFRREVFESVGGFDEAAGNRSDSDFARRVRRAGWEPRSVDDAITYCGDLDRRASHGFEPVGRLVSSLLQRIGQL